jgi:hypothetical protein
MIFMIEAQVNYLVQAVAAMRQRRIRAVEVRREIQDRYFRWLQDRLSRSVWNTGGCSSWYLDKHGENTTIWPGFSYEFLRVTRRFDIESYHLSTLGTS